MTAFTPSSSPRTVPVLDPDFLPAVVWNRGYQKRVAASGAARQVALALVRPDGTAFRWQSEMLPDRPEYAADNLKYLERTLKFLLWQKGGSRIRIAGASELVAKLAAIYSERGERAFDWDFIGRRIFGEPIEVAAVAAEDLPPSSDQAVALGRNLGGCRIGFDLGGSDRKCAAIIDGEVVHSEEVVWDPYFEKDPTYHLDGIHDSLQRAAAHLPRVDAIGGSAAGVYVNNEVRAASLFRGVSEADFESKVRGIFSTLKQRWGGVPFEVVNDGEVTALAGAMALGDDAVLGVAMGTSEAAGYVDAAGHIRPWLNELAFAPVDYRETGPLDEWSGDRGCGVQFFSQQGVARLAPLAGMDFGDMPYPEQLIQVQQAIEAGDERARRIYQTLGVCFGYAIAHYADFYEIRNLLVLGRVTSGKGGEILVSEAEAVLASAFPELQVKCVVPDEKTKRHGQAVAAASLPTLS